MTAGLSIANQLRTQSQGLLQANKNAADAVGLLQVADGALGEYTDLLTQARDKALDASSDTNSPEARTALENDVKALLEQANEIATTTAFNGIKLLDGTFTNKQFQVGSESGQTMNVSIANTDAASQSLEDDDIDLTSQSGAEDAVTSIDTAIKSIDGIRSGIGSNQIALESRIRVNDITAVNVQSAESQIRDVDMAAESAKANQLTLQQQAGFWAAQQAQNSQSMIMQLLR